MNGYWGREHEGRRGYLRFGQAVMPGQDRAVERGYNKSESLRLWPRPGIPGRDDL